ncbi:MAG: hypothetical protein ACREQ5_33680, partial [Candidatus Dormibacteria bacterium]
PRPRRRTLEHPHLYWRRLAPTATPHRRSESMFAVVMRTELAEGYAVAHAREMLETQVVPMFRRTPGFVAGYWLAPESGREGLSVILYEDEQSARTMADTAHSRPQASLLSVEVREVAASASA